MWQTINDIRAGAVGAEDAKAIVSGVNTIMRTARLEYEMVSKTKGLKPMDILGVEVESQPKEIGYEDL